ncbi:MAG: type 4a pilus biogenesis protein PilO [Candidatus Colwellbacteria bacterium]|nr:type 4a pilus biogenesis protein PilO [Candidatus Colwellbacteria bacterium]
MKSSAKRALSVVGVVLLFGASVLVFTSLIRPEFDLIQQARSRREAGGEVLERARTVGRVIGNLRTAYESMTEFQQGVSNSLPVREDAPTLLNHVQGLAGLNKLVLNSVSFQPRELELSQDDVVWPTRTIRVTIQTEGRYENLKEFLRDLETNVRLTDVRSLRLRSMQSRPDMFTLDIAVDAYYQTIGSGT